VLSWVFTLGIFFEKVI